MKKLIFLIFPVWLMAQYETQQFETIKTTHAYSIRFYPPAMMAKHSSTNGANSGFGYLFNYISGGNVSQTKIAMTTPVRMEKGGGQSSMAFVLPRKFTNTNTPAPRAAAVEIFEDPGGYFAAMGFPGYTNTKKEQKVTEGLYQALRSAKIKVTGAPIVLVYNSPYKFYNRKNEILIPIEWE